MQDPIGPRPLVLRATAPAQAGVGRAMAVAAAASLVGILGACGANTVKTQAPVEPADAGAVVAFSSLRSSAPPPPPGATCFPSLPCGDGGWTAAAYSLEVRGADSPQGERLGPDSTRFRVTPHGCWHLHETVVQRAACTARLVAPGRIVVDTRFCFSIRDLGDHLEPASCVGRSAECSLRGLQPGHYIATADGVSVEFDIPAIVPGGGVATYTQLLGARCRPEAARPRDVE